LFAGKIDMLLERHDAIGWIAHDLNLDLFREVFQQGIKNQPGAVETW
jgi:hypothetical protein